MSLDPRPAYQHDDERLYGMFFGSFNVRFCVYTNKICRTRNSASSSKRSGFKPNLFEIELLQFRVFINFSTSNIVK